MENIISSQSKLIIFSKNSKDVINKKRTLKDEIINGTLGKKIYILKLVQEKKMSWLYTTKSGKNNRNYSKEQFIDFLITSKYLRNSITHNTFVLSPEMWELIYENSIGKRITDRNLSIKEMVNEILKELGETLRIADYTLLKNRLVNHINREIKDKGYELSDLNNLVNIEYILKK